MISNKKAFTLAEVTITLFMLSVLVAITIPVVVKISPSNSKVGFRNAYNIASTTIDSLINNEILYPSEQVIDSVNTPITKGFFYTETGSKTLPAITVDDPTGTVDLAYEYEAITRQCMCTDGSKLVRLFCCSQNVSTATCTASKCDITTNNGMSWTLTQSTTVTTANRDSIPYMTIDVDINGATHPNSATTNEPDKFKLNVFYNGRIEVDTSSSTKGRSYLETPTDSKKYDPARNI